MSLKNIEPQICLQKVTQKCVKNAIFSTMNRDIKKVYQRYLEFIITFKNFLICCILLNFGNINLEERHRITARKTHVPCADCPDPQYTNILLLQSAGSTCSTGCVQKCFQTQNRL